MSWHSDSYPGRSALLCSGADADTENFLRGFTQDHAAFEKAREHVAAVDLLERLTGMSPFQQVVVAECWALCEQHTAGHLTRADLLWELRNRARHCYLALGQTKVVEDLFHDLRDRETRDTYNKTIATAHQWMHCVHGQVLQTQGRTPVDSQGQDVPAHTKVEPSWFSTADHKPSFDFTSLTGPRDWAYFAANETAGVPAGMALLRHLHRTDQWAIAEACCFSFLVPLGTIFLDKLLGRYFMSLGSIVGLCVVAWPMDRVRVKAKLWSLTFAPPTAGVTFVPVLKHMDFSIVLHEVWSPMRGFIRGATD